MLGQLGEGYRATGCKRVVSEEGNLGGRGAGEGEGWKIARRGRGTVGGRLSFSLQ